MFYNLINGFGYGADHDAHVEKHVFNIINCACSIS